MYGSINNTTPLPLRPGHHERPNRPRKILFGRAMRDQPDDLLGPGKRVFDCEIVAVEAKEMPHRLEGRALVALRECVRLCDARHQYDREPDQVCFAKSKEILRPSQGTLQQSAIA